MLKLLIHRLIVIGVLGVVSLLFNTCSTNDDDNDLHTNMVIPTYTYNNTLNGYVYLNCSNTPAVYYPIVLYQSSNTGYVAINDYFTDNTGHYQISYTYSSYEGMWLPISPYYLFFPRDSIYVSLPYDTAYFVHSSPYDTTITINNSNVVINDSAHFRVRFKFSQPYSSSDTVYYVLNLEKTYPNNYTFPYIVGPFPTSIVLNYSIPKKYLWISPSSMQYYFNWGMGIKEFQSWPPEFTGNYKNCSSIDSLIINY